MKNILVIAFLISASVLVKAQATTTASPDSTSRVEEATPMLSNNQRLYILDDVEITYEEMKKLDAEKIESVTLLKDLKSISAYGDKGKHGVIIISTKNKEKKKMPRKG
jgi:hypothetical protein